MKKLITILLLILGVNGFGQKDSIVLKGLEHNKPANGIGQKDSLPSLWLSFDTTKIKREISFSDWRLEGFISVAMMFPDSSIEIRGDTIKAIKMLFKSTLDNQEKQYKELEQHYEFMEAATKWSNTVPDGYKNSKQWKAFEAVLKKNGYRVNTKRQVNKGRFQPQISILILRQ